MLLAFKSWHSALPWFPIANRAETAVALLVELLADDQARRVVDDRVLATAIALVASAHTGAVSIVSARADGTAPAPGRAIAGPASGSPANRVEPRVRRLILTQPPLPPATRVGVLAASAALLVTPALLLLTA